MTTSVIGRGLLAGAVGTTLLNMATWVDMAVTGRAGSDAPDRTAVGVTKAVGLTPPQDPHRVQALGALSGIGAGLGVGVLASAARTAGLRMPAPVAAAAIGAAAVAAEAVPMALTGVDDPSTWSAADWTKDAVPHLVYGAGVRWALDRLEPPAGEPDAVASPSPHLLARSFALGVASGGRTSYGVAGPGLASHGAVTALTGTLLATELVMDKLPSTPSRLALPVLGGRVASAVLGAGALARRAESAPTAPAVAAGAGALVGSLAGAMWRDYAEQRGWRVSSALAEDAVGLGLTLWASR